MSREKVPNCPIPLNIETVAAIGCTGIPTYEICLSCSYLSRPTSTSGLLDFILSQRGAAVCSDQIKINDWQQRKQEVLSSRL